ncbi:MAG: class I SAM-dependent methyltransferase, partial [Candidatus Thorarchaeota archaeon]
GIDISINMLKLAIKTSRNSPNRQRCEVILTDLENLPIRANAFNCVFSITSLQNLYDIRKGILEMIRTSKVGANLNISILKKQLDTERLYSVLRDYCFPLLIDEEKNIEDLLIKSKVIKSLVEDY